MRSQLEFSSLNLNVLPKNNYSSEEPESPLLRNSHIDLNQYPDEPESPLPRNSHIDLNQFPNEDGDGAFICNTAVESSSMNHPANKKKNLSIEKKRAVFEMLHKEQQDGKLSRGLRSKVANSFSISKQSVSKIWNEGKSFSTMSSDLRFSSKLLNRRCRQRIGICFEKMTDIPLRRRTNIRSLSNALNISKSTVHRRIKEGSIRPHSNPIKPYLSEENKKTRLEFCLSMIDEGTIASKPIFINMYDRIHIDEKWFYMSNTSNKYYLHPNEPDPLRTCKSKRFIPKLMFLAAVARPRFDATANEEFDGKIGIWAFVTYEPAKRSSKNREAGTLETKPIMSITKDVIRSCILQNVLPTIKEKWPCSGPRTIIIQQDNAKPHLDINDVEFLEASRRDGFDIRLCCQPPNSPDMNVLDLGFFRAIDSLQHQESPSTIDELILAVENAFTKFPAENLNKVFLTLQSCMVEVMKDFGGINYKIPHLNKEKLIRDGKLPDCIEVDCDVLEVAKAALSSC